MNKTLLLSALLLTTSATVVHDLYASAPLVTDAYFIGHLKDKLVFDYSKYLEQRKTIQDLSLQVDSLDKINPLKVKLTELINVIFSFKKEAGRLSELLVEAGSDEIADYSSDLQTKIALMNGDCKDSLEAILNVLKSDTISKIEATADDTIRKLCVDMFFLGIESLKKLAITAGISDDFEIKLNDATIEISRAMSIRFV